MRGGDKFRQRLAELSAQAATAKVRVGIIEQANYDGSDGESVAQVAFWNEYGTARTPARPFFRNTIAERKTEWARLAGKFMQANGGDVRQSLSYLGQVAVEDIKQTIINGNFAPNSEVTKLLKYRFPTSPARVTAAAYYKAVRDVQQGKTVVSNHDKPLQWSTTMRDSINYEVTDE
ncbi:hypothetical protein [Neisseria elongata]